MRSAEVARPPLLVTRRLLLRELRPTDADAVAAGAGDRRVAQFLVEVPSPYPVALARRWIAARVAWWELGRGVTFAITRREAPEALLGTVSLRRDARAGAGRSAELGYWLAVPAWGLGYATEAAGAAVEFGFQQLGLSRIRAQVFTDNAASLRVLDKIGMVNEGTWPRHLRKGGRRLDVVCYGLSREEWPRRPR